MSSLGLSVFPWYHTGKRIGLMLVSARADSQLTWAISKENASNYPMCSPTLIIMLLGSRALIDAGLKETIPLNTIDPADITLTTQTTLSCG